MTHVSVGEVDVSKYIQSQNEVPESSREAHYQRTVDFIRRFRPVDERTRILEIGSGTGWFQIMCLRHGLHCSGVEISPALVENTHELGRRFGLKPDVVVGNVEQIEFGREKYDVIIADSVLEHVRDWQLVVKKVYDALAPGGVFYFSTTNKFSPVSGEYTKLPLYGWLPDAARYKFRQLVDGPQVMTLGIDFHQFTYPRLRRFMRHAGFREVLDFIEMKDPSKIRGMPGVRGFVLRSVKSSSLLRHLLLTFWLSVEFVCVK